MKRFCIAIFATLMIWLIFSGCSANSDKKLTDEFNGYLKKYYTFTEEYTYPFLYSSEKLRFGEAILEVEDVDYGTYHIVATMGNMLTNPRDQIWSISANELKQEMKKFAETFISFAKEKDMDNDYYLYIKIYYNHLSCFVYDYEKDILYIPEKHDQYREMYSLFGTTSDSEISKTQEGVNWLVQNGFGEIKHNEYESIRDMSAPNVFIDEEGNFNSYSLHWKYND